MQRKIITGKKNNIINEQNRAATKSIDAGRGTVTELAEINAARDKAFADLITRNKAKYTIEAQRASVFTGEKLRKSRS